VRKTVLLSASMGLAVLLACALAAGVSYSAVSQKPNIILVMTDDQSVNTLWSMGRVRGLLAGQGTTLTNAHFAYPRGCPSRATILRGQYPHNTGLYRNENGANYFRHRGLDRSTVAVWLNRAGYDTALIGKYLNDQKISHIPPGWDY
jgi:N-acetylglucosamine-6-sulfatase